MPKTDAVKAKAPRGAKAVSQAFFDALGSVPEAGRSAVERAALAMIRERSKTLRDKAKVARAREKAAPKSGAKLTPAKASVKGVVSKARKALGDGMQTVADTVSKSHVEDASFLAKRQGRPKKPSTKLTAT